VLIGDQHDPEEVAASDDEMVRVGLPRVDRSDRGYGDRVDGWVRPEYRSMVDEPPSGEYWTPIPVDLDLDPEPSAKGYGWPRPVERLPAVPPYEPATGFDLTPVPAEPTEVVPVWPPINDDRPGRIRLPRSWATRNEKYPGEERPSEAEAGAGETVPLTERRARRPRPRPRPDAKSDRSARADRTARSDRGADRTAGADRSTVYVSRHAAEPPA
jgi:hypothetical protein